MSMNIHLHATREVQVVKTGKIVNQQTDFLYCWQTPTTVTRDILNATDPASAYCEWVLTQSVDCVEAVYADDDIFQEGPEIGMNVINLAKDHVAGVQAWIKGVEAEGFDIVFEAV